MPAIRKYMPERSPGWLVPAIGCVFWWVMDGLDTPVWYRWVVLVVLIAIWFSWRFLRTWRYGFWIFYGSLVVLIAGCLIIRPPEPIVEEPVSAGQAQGHQPAVTRTRAMYSSTQKVYDRAGAPMFSQSVNLDNVASLVMMIGDADYILMALAISPPVIEEQPKEDFELPVGNLRFRQVLPENAVPGYVSGMTSDREFRFRIGGQTDHDIGVDERLFRVKLAKIRKTDHGREYTFYISER